MKVSLIAAIDENRLIGTVNGGLPWQGVVRDKRHFHNYVKGKSLLLGRRTFEEMKGWFVQGHRPIVLTRNKCYELTLVGSVAFTLEQAISVAEAQGEDELVVCGGAEVYALAIDFADQIILTILHTTFDVEGEGKYFPDWERNGFRVVSKERFTEGPGNPFAMSVMHLTH